MPARGARLEPVNRQVSRLQRKLQECIGSRSIQSVADEMDVPYWVVRDTLRGTTDCPAGRHLPKIARWLNESVEELIDDAYSVAEPVPA